MDYNDNLFLKCYNHLLDNEGGYVNHPNDTGGETYKGIARNMHPSWDGWKIIDELKSKGGFPGTAYMNDYLSSSVRNFYRDKFWDLMNLSLIIDENVCLQLFDMAVNAGRKTAIKIAQRACEGHIKIDGVLGSKTAFEINAMGSRFLDAYIDQRIKYYEEIVKKHPKNEVFLKGWIRRAKNTKFTY
jgi:lysozyme family protein